MRLLLSYLLLLPPPHLVSWSAEARARVLAVVVVMVVVLVQGTWRGGLGGTVGRGNAGRASGSGTCAVEAVAALVTGP